MFQEKRVLDQWMYGWAKTGTGSLQSKVMHFYNNVAELRHFRGA
jgi:hypothetical protein